LSPDENYLQSLDFDLTWWRLFTIFRFWSSLDEDYSQSLDFERHLMKIIQDMCCIH